MVKKSWPIGSCIDAEDRWLSVMSLKINGYGDIIHPTLQRKVASIITGSVYDPDTWLQVPPHTQICMFVKNLSCDPILQSIVGERNALLMLDGVAYIALMISDTEARVVRPCVFSHQSELQEKYSRAILHAQYSAPSSI